MTNESYEVGLARFYEANEQFPSAFMEWMKMNVESEAGGFAVNLVVKFRVIDDFLFAMDGDRTWVWDNRWVEVTP